MAPARTCQMGARERRTFWPRSSLALWPIVSGWLLVMTSLALADCDPERAPTVCNPVHANGQQAAGLHKTHDRAARRDHDKSARTAAKLPVPSVVPVLTSPPRISAVKDADRTGITDDGSRSGSGALLRLWLGITLVLFLIFEFLYRYAPRRNLRNLSLYLRWAVFRWRQWRFEGGNNAASWFASPFRDPAGHSPV